jgi:hypothetical protein
VGISFEQSASTEYFRRVRQALASMGRAEEVAQARAPPSRLLAATPRAPGRRPGRTWPHVLVLGFPNS